MTALLAGAFGVLGTLGGVGLSTWMGRAAEARRLKEADARRWQADRRAAYAAFLLLAESLLRDIDGVAIFLSYDGEVQVSEDDEGLLSDGLTDYFIRWDDELQPALVEVQLLAGAQVADLADRTSGALMEITGVVETRGAFASFYPQWFRARDLLGVLRNAMRRELGLHDEVDAELPRQGDWPWLDGRPSEEDYIRRQAAIPGRHPVTEAEMARVGETGILPEKDHRGRGRGRGR